MAIGAAHRLIDELVFLFGRAGNAHGPLEGTQLRGKILSLLKLEIRCCGFASCNLDGVRADQVIPDSTNRECVLPRLHVAAREVVSSLRVAHHRHGEVTAAASSAHDDSLHVAFQLRADDAAQGLALRGLRMQLCCDTTHGGKYETA